MTAIYAGDGDSHPCVEIEVSPACERCVQPGRVLTRLRDIAEFNPRGVVAGLYVLFGVALGALGAYLCIVVAGFVVSEWLGAIVSSRISEVINGIGTGLGAAFWILFAHYFPLQALVCPGCRRAVAYRLGRSVPVQWLERIPPKPICLSCGYSLVGASAEPRCPECGRAFPQEWLALTRLAKADVEIQIVLKEDVDNGFA